jgi:hypothetical protein
METSINNRTKHQPFSTPFNQLFFIIILFYIKMGRVRAFPVFRLAVVCLGCSFYVGIYLYDLFLNMNIGMIIDRRY